MLATTIYLLLIAGALLVLLPQLAAYGVGRVAERRGSWGPVLLAVVAAPAVFALIAVYLYDPAESGLLQRLPEASRSLAVRDLRTWSIGHAAAAAFVQVVRLWRG